MISAQRINPEIKMETILAQSVGGLNRPIIAGLVKDIIHVPARVDLRERALHPGHMALLLDGFVSRHIDDHLGQRQVVALQIPGDFIDLCAPPARQHDHDIATISTSRLALIDSRGLWEALGAHPDLTRKLWSIGLMEAAIHRQWIFRQGRLSARARLAHFLCEMNIRLLKIGQSNGHSFRLPLTQSDLSEICGLSSVHINRVLKDLREMSLCLFRFGRVDITDPIKLANLAQFDPQYLDPPHCLPFPSPDAKEF